MNKFISMYVPGYASVLVYMLQSTEYEVKPYIEWYHRTQDFGRVMYRRKLDKTKAAGLLLLGLSLGMITQVVIGVICIIFGYTQDRIVLTVLGTLLVFTYPIVWAYLVVVPLLLGRVFIINPKNRRLITRSKQIFADHKGIKIAVAGSYGKTSMKELLSTVLSEGRDVAATPGNKNVSASHAYFAKRLTGREDILVIEYGEGKPGDVAAFAEITQPNIGIITGLAPAHLNHYPTLEAAGQDIFALARYVGDDNTHANGESAAIKPFLASGMHVYDEHGALGWKVSNLKISFNGTSFVMKKGKQEFRLKSGLLGRHQVGPLVFVAALADKLGLSQEQIETGISKTEPFEHRMQARALRGAWIIDDTYNGNIDGMKAGLALLKELPGKRKIYVTPGLVDQGVETEAVHVELGKAIARANPDKVVLMYNSATDIIARGLKAGEYEGEIQVEHYPLDFYVNLEHFLAAGDIVLLQNDWTDSYN